MKPPDTDRGSIDENDLEVHDAKTAACALGTSNMPECSNMCHESTNIALQEFIGIGKASVTVRDVWEADLILIAGQNPGTDHPRMLSALM